MTYRYTPNLNAVPRKPLGPLQFISFVLVKVKLQHFYNELMNYFSSKDLFQFLGHRSQKQIKLQTKNHKTLSTIFVFSVKALVNPRVVFLDIRSIGIGSVLCFSISVRNNVVRRIENKLLNAASKLQYTVPKSEHARYVLYVHVQYM